MKHTLLNFDKKTFRASGVGYLMTEPKEKSPLDKYNDFVQSYEKKKSELTEKIADSSIKLSKINPEKTKASHAKEKSRGEKFNLELTALINASEPIKEALEKDKNKTHLSLTCIKKLIEIWIEEMSGRRKDITNRYIKKGNENEDKSIDILIERDDRYYTKNTERRYNTFIEGECDIEDIEENETIIDIKTSWDIFTFLPKDIEEVDTIYWWQGQCYMKLWDGRKFRLCYVLTDTPEDLIKDEQTKLLWNMGSGKKDTEAYELGCQEIRINMTYPDLSVSDRVIEKPVILFSEEAYERLCLRIIECRKWLNEFAIKQYIRCHGVDNLLEHYPEEYMNFMSGRSAENIEDEISEELKEIDEEIKSKHEEVSNFLKKEEIMKDGDTIHVSLSVAEKVKEILSEETSYTETIIDEIVEITEEKILSPISEEILEYTKDEVLDAEYETDEEEAARIEKENSLQRDETTELDLAITKIDSCSTKDEVIALYPKIKPLFDKYPSLKEFITQKKESFNAPTPVPQAAPKPVPVAAPKPVAQTAPKLVAKKEKTNPEESEEYKRIKELSESAKNADDIRNLFLANREFIKLKENESLFEMLQQAGMDFENGIR